MTAGRSGNRVSISSGMVITRILPNCLYVSSKAGILSVRASADDCSPSGATDGIGAVVSFSVAIPTSRILLDPVDELVLRHKQPLANAQRGKGPRVEELIRSRARDAQRRRELIGIQHRREIFVVVVHVRPPLKITLDTIDFLIYIVIVKSSIACSISVDTAFVNRFFSRALYQSILEGSMIPGKSHPRPYQRLWVGAYTDKKSEYFELRTADKTGKFSYSPLWHKYAPLGSAITDFLYDDLKRFDSDLSAVKRRVDAVNAGQGREQALQELFDLARLWLNDNPLYAPLAAAAERLELSAESGDPLNTDELERMMEEYAHGSRS